MSLRHLGLTILTLGFLIGAFFSVSEIDHVPWLPYGCAIALAFVGLVIVRLTSKQAATHSAKLKEDLRLIGQSLDGLVRSVDTLIAKRDALEVFDVHGEIDETLREDLDRAAEARECLIPLYGMQAYADLMTRFARGERLVNRAWSASADGYVDEVWLALDEAAADLHQAKSLLDSYQRGTTGQAVE